MRLTLLLALLAFPSFADEKPKPNTLTPKEIAEGWIMLFDGETTFGWKVEGEAKVKDGAIILGGKEKSSLVSMTAMSDYHCVCEGSIDGTAWEKLSAIISPTGKFSRSPSNLLDGTAFDQHLRFCLQAGQKLHLRSVKLRPEETRSLFNAKDLTGWKTYDPAKAKVADPKAKEVKVASKYSVTKEGWLNVKDGGGDLQTEGQWADFVLQFECISNGKHLNSGMFFRCIPDLYQQGYEAQIRNEWMGDDRAKPVDFGTGAIYRRQPARKVVSTDGEWFTMTVAAHGRHIATWVNGYQTVDWTDDRKEADNARQGFKKSKGALSIQGHDPTTDLSFRNIRIQSLDAK